MVMAVPDDDINAPAQGLNSQMQSQAYSTLNEAGDYLIRVLNGYDEVCAYQS